MSRRGRRRRRRRVDRIGRLAPRLARVFRRLGHAARPARRAPSRHSAGWSRVRSRRGGARLFLVANALVNMASRCSDRLPRRASTFAHRSRTVALAGRASGASALRRPSRSRARRCGDYARRGGAAQMGRRTLAGPQTCAARCCSRNVLSRWPLRRAGAVLDARSAVGGQAPLISRSVCVGLSCPRQTTFFRSSLLTPASVAHGGARPEPGASPTLLALSLTPAELPAHPPIAQVRLSLAHHPADRAAPTLPARRRSSTRSPRSRVSVAAMPALPARRRTSTCRSGAPVALAEGR